VTLYRPRAEPFEAVQWRGDNLQEVKDFGVTVLSYDPEAERLKIDTTDADIYGFAQLGDYIVRFQPDGGFYVDTREWFESVFEPVSVPTIDCGTGSVPGRASSGMSARRYSQESNNAYTRVSLRAVLDYDNIPILAGVAGSTAYGLDTETSDRDVLSCHIIKPPSRLLGLQAEDLMNHSVVAHNPDVTSHEIGKLFRLAMKCNPTVLELFWLPSYGVCNRIGEELIEHRSMFLHEHGVRGAYFGYAQQQANRLAQRHASGRVGFDPDLANRTAKHGRHCFRLMLEGESLLRTGNLSVDVSDHRDELFEMGELALNDPDKFAERFNERKDKLDAIQSVLPNRQPDFRTFDDMLIRLRLESMYY
jgi:uncharacterized protein